MLKIGITGDAGFIGKNLSRAIELYPDSLKRIDFNKTYFKDFNSLSQFVLQCDVIVHLAALSRHTDIGFVFDNNVFITEQLIKAMSAQDVKPYLIFTSSIHDQNETEYGKSKREEYKLLSNWAKKNNANFSCLVLNNIYGPFCKPNYASFVATFCYKLSRNESPLIDVDNLIRLKYVGNLTDYILNKIVHLTKNECVINEYVSVPYDVEVKVSFVLDLLNKIKENYSDYRRFPNFSDELEKNLFTTFSSYFEEI